MQDHICLTELARLFGVSKQVMWRRAKRPGAPASLKIGTRRYFRRDEAITSPVLRLP